MNVVDDQPREGCGDAAVHPPERVVTIEDLKADFELGGLRNFPGGLE